MSFDFSTLITDRTAADVYKGTAKGSYNASDLNRVTEAMEYLHDVLTSKGYAVDYKRIEIPRKGTVESVVLNPDSIIEGDEYDTHVFTAPGTGMFLCEVDWGTGRNSQSVFVENNGTYTVDLTDTRLFLYKDGDECEDVTGGWSMYNTSSNPYYGVAHTEKPIDVTGYNTLCIYYDLSNHASTERRVCHFFVGDSKTGWDSDTLGELLVARPSDGIARLDISALTGEKYVKFGNYDSSTSGWTRILTKNEDHMAYRRYYGNNQYDLTGYIYKVWLE